MRIRPARSRRARPSGRKSAPLPSPPAIRTRGDVEAVHRRDGGADVRPLGIVVPVRAAGAADRLAAVREPGEAAKRAADRAAVDSEVVRDRHRREGVERVVAPGERERPDLQPPFGPAGKPGPAAVLGEAVLALARALRGEGDDPRALPGEARAEPREPRIVTADHRRRGAPEDAGLGRAVGIEPAVAVEMIGAHVEKRRDPRTQGAGRLELEARELDDVELRVVREQGEGGRAEIPADGRVSAVRLRHGVDPGAHGALAVRPRHRDDRGASHAGEQLDLAEHRNPAIGRGRHRGLARRYPGAQHQLDGLLEPFSNRIRRVASPPRAATGGPPPREAGTSGCPRVRRRPRAHAGGGRTRDRCRRARPPPCAHAATGPPTAP